MITKKYIVWDWNGTIIDDVGIALDAVNDMLREKKRPGNHTGAVSSGDGYADSSFL